MIRRISATLVLIVAILSWGSGCKTKRPVEPPIDPHKLVVVNALWGALYRGLTTDVTEIVRGLVQKDALSVTATAGLLGDPAPGKVKYLRVVYQKGGVLAKKMVGEGGTLTVGQDENSTPPRLVVTKAVYGDLVGGQTADITLGLAEMVQDNRLFVNDYNGVFGDPAKNKSKQLRVEYIVDGHAQSRVVAENEALELSVPERP